MSQSHETLPPLSADPGEAARRRRARTLHISRWALPVTMIVIAILAWDSLVRINGIPHYILPGPGLVAETLVADRAILLPAAWVTAKITLMALAVAVIGGVGLALLFSLSPLAERSFYPFAVILQVTPVVAIAPLIFIYIGNHMVGLLLCAWLVAFFPILSNTSLGLRSADHNLRDLFTIYGASRWQRLRLLQIPSALPYFLGGLRIAGGLALIGAVVAEYVAGTGGIGSGLAFRILEAGYRLNVPRMFAALVLIGALGVAVFLATSLVSWLLLRRWHESAVQKQN
ncbi:MAG: ABC transporter permease [Paracoccus sp. (in: a-proteobacteria)]|nr:ABC transporter permease [Paracoccus sp. (in: a-proteobacteria)]